MIDKIAEISVVETLRLKTEELDMNQYLKTKWGGYTKQSVLEYLNVLRKLQQTTADTFARNLQTIYNEKEAIKKNNEGLQHQLVKIESEYKNLCESMKAIQLEDSNLTMQDIHLLKNKNAAMEEELQKSSFEKDALENKIKHLNVTIDDLTELRKQTEQELAAAKEMILAEKQESKELRDKVVGLTIIVEDKTDEIKYLKALQAEGRVAELTSHINHLSNQLETQTEVMANLNSETSRKGKTIETLTAETEMQKEMLSDLNKTVAALQTQNEKLLLANANFADQLQDGFSKTIDFINEKSDITIEKIAANRKLDEANSKIAILEREILKNNKLEEFKELDKMKKTEELEDLQIQEDRKG